MPTPPLQDFRFQIHDDTGFIMGFAEVSGLGIDNKLYDYRRNTGKEKFKVKIPSIQKSGNISLKRGVCKAGGDFFNWLRAGNRTGDRSPKNFIIYLLDENQKPVISWKIQNAIPVKLEGPLLQAGGNEVAIESLDLTCEGLAIGS